MLRGTTNMFPADLVGPDLRSERFGGSQLDLTAVSGGHDFVLRAANAICARAALTSMKLPWIAPIDAQRSLRSATTSSRSAPLIQYYGTGAPRTATRIHTTPTAEPSTPRPWSGKPHSSKEEK